MSLALEFALILFLLVVALGLLPLLTQLRRSARALETFLEASRGDLARIAEDAHASRLRMDHLAETLQASAEEVEGILRTAGEVGHTLRTFNDRFHNALESAAGRFGGILGGISTLLTFLKRTPQAHPRGQEHTP
jgi:hypothetical protein